MAGHTQLQRAAAADGFDRTRVAARLGIGDEVNERTVESEAGERHCGGKICVLRINARSLTGAATKNNSGPCQTIEVIGFRGRGTPPGLAGLPRSVFDRAQPVASQSEQAIKTCERPGRDQNLTATLLCGSEQRVT